MDGTSLPIFPLHAVLFPGGPLALRIFEPRYLDMVGRVLRGDARFGVCLIREGRETGPAARTHRVGTRVRIVDWHRRVDGLLGVTVMGEQRFNIVDSEVGSDQLVEARVTLRENEPPTPLPGRYKDLAQLLRTVLSSAGPVYEQFPGDFDDAVWVGGRLVELLPFPLSEKQALLEMDGPITRLDRVCALLDRQEQRP
ncbi:MAG TPA: LON peptidase substrate-binding domain-containing protein [Gammaproteobacteria bacterium]|nr:LON peptidase substrate-binding domain-containing protein [Gammaproteobacteria bacterium]